MRFWTIAIFVSIAISVSGLECPEGTVYLSVFKQNSGSRFNQADESFMIAGYFNSTRRILVRERPLMEFRAKHTYEYCLKRTPSLIYDVVLKDSKEDGWDDGSYVEIRGKDGFLFFKGSCIEGKEEVYRIRMTYIISPFQNWGVFSEEMEYSRMWREIDTGNAFLDDFSRDWMRENEESPSYEHVLLGYPSENNVYFNRFVVEEKEEYTAIEVGFTNDFEDIAVYMNGILIYEESNHVSNNRNYFRILYSGDVLHTGSNVIMIVIDAKQHLNNAYLYGYPATPSQRCLYVPTYKTADHSPILENHIIERLFDYSSEYFYFDGSKDVYATIDSSFYDAIQLHRYGIYNYVFAYATREWDILGSNDGVHWDLLDHQDDPYCTNILAVYRYPLHNTGKAYKQYKVHIHRNKGYMVTWLPEFYPYICNQDNAHKPLYVGRHQVQHYLRIFQITSTLSSEEVQSQKIQFSVEPPLPKTVTIDPATGNLSGYFSAEDGKFLTYVIRADGLGVHRQMAMTIQLKEDFDYDFAIVNNHIVYYNYYTQTPFFVLFLAIGIALSVVGCVILIILL